MHKIKITAIRKADYKDLQQKYENPIQHACDIQEGQVFIANGWQRPEGMCESAWESISPFVMTLAHGGENIYDGWMRNPKSAMISCNDGFRPVSFLIEVLEEEKIKTMKEDKTNPFEIDFDSYILQSEPEQQENGKLWQTAIGLQQVDGLTPSKYLYETAKRNIDGEITIEEAKQLIDSYYETRQGRTEDEDDAEEADKVSVRIREILAEKTFSFTPDLLLSIHKRLFTGVFCRVKAGYFRDYNISKHEWVLDGESVLYANADMIRQTLDYDFSQEKAFDYSKLSIEESIKHLTRFIANIWQIHPFGEGNTRTTAVFTIKYLNSLGFEVNNEPFEKNSWYFRNALVRANYTNMNIGIYMNTEYLEKFFRNLLLGESNELKNRYCHIKYNEKVAIKSQKSSDKTATKEKSSDIVLNYLKENASINNSTAREITGLTAPAVRKIFKKLEAEGLIAGTGENKNRTYSLKR